MLTSMLKYTDGTELKQRALPKSSTSLSQAKINKIKSMTASGFTNAEIAEALNVSTSTVSGYINN